MSKIVPPQTNCEVLSDYAESLKPVAVAIELNKKKIKNTKQL